MIIIDKPDFERALPVGMAANEDVFASVYPAIEDAMNNYYEILLGDIGAQAVESADDDAPLKRHFKALVCVAGFSSVARQLDLVLTPTGFGVVNTDTVSPASKQRVDALIGQLLTARSKARAMVAHLLRADEWGATPQAVRAIRYLYTDHYFFFGNEDNNYTAQDWVAQMAAVIDTDEQVRLRFGDEQIDDMLDAYRRNDRDRLRGYAGALQMICDLTDKWAVMGRKAVETPQYRRLVREMEGDNNIFALYHGSEAYKAAHIENFKNNKESSAYLFNG